MSRRPGCSKEFRTPIDASRFEPSSGKVSRKVRLRAGPASPPNTAETGSLNDCSFIARGASSRNGHLNFQVIEWQCSKGSSLVSTKGRRVLPNAFVLDFDILILQLEISSLDSDRQKHRQRSSRTSIIRATPPNHQSYFSRAPAQ
ncbi:hypothetical protein K523DRAFT_147156 [Schizophyllum commune Tattone D]|nr:hypothetical protein K523DRAFT_147156 [Schizophyllum commune Tattone D]